MQRYYWTCTGSWRANDHILGQVPWRVCRSAVDGTSCMITIAWNVSRVLLAPDVYEECR